MIHKKDLKVQFESTIWQKIGSIKRKSDIWVIGLSIAKRLLLQSGSSAFVQFAS